VPGNSSWCEDKEPTECIWAQILVAVCPLVVGAVDGRVARHVLGLLLLVLLAAVEHLLEEAELGADGADQGEEQDW